MANINFLSDSHNVGHVGIGVEPTSDNMLVVKSVSDLTSSEQIALFETDTSGTTIRLKADNSLSTDDSSSDIQALVTGTKSQTRINTDSEGVNSDKIRDVQFGFAGSERFTMRVTADASGSNPFFGIGRNTPTSTIDANSKATAANPGELFLRISTGSTIEAGVGSQIIFGVGSDATNNFNSSLIKGLRTSDDDGSSNLSFWTTDRSQAAAPAERVAIAKDGAVTFNTIANATSDTDKFLVSDGGVLKYRTGAEVLADIGASSGSGTVESVAITVGTGLDVSGSPITTTGTIDIDLDLTELTLGAGLDSTATGLSLDLSEFTDMTSAMIGTDEFIVLDNSAERRKAANEIGLSIFDNDAGFTTNTGTVTGTGTAGRVAFWNSGSGITSDPDLTFDNINLTCGGVYLASSAGKTGPSYSFTGDSNTGMYRDSADVLAFAAGGSTYVRVSTSGLSIVDDLFHHGDSDTKMSFGTNTITFTTQGTEAFTINEDSDVVVPDNQKIIFGAGSDLEIYSDGTDGYIAGSTDDLIISSQDDVVIKTQTSENAINCVGNGKVSLYYNNSERWETLSDGAGTDGDIIETISNGGGKRIGFNVGDSFTFNSNTIAHYGMSNAGNETDNTGGIVLSGYFGLRFATNGTMRAMIKSNGDTALLSHTLVSGFDENNSSTSYYYIPLAGSITEGTSSQYYRTFACPQAGRVVSIMMMHTSGTAVSLNTYTTQLRVIKNGSTAATSSELSASNGNSDGSYIEYTPDVDFNKGDRLGFQFSKSNTAMRWRGTSATIMIELDDYNL